MPRKDEVVVELDRGQSVEKFVKRHYEGEGVAELAKEYGISRATAYNWINRHQERLLEKDARAGMSPASREKSEKMTLIAKIKQLEAENTKLRNKVVSLMIKSGEL